MSYYSHIFCLKMFNEIKIVLSGTFFLLGIVHKTIVCYQKYEACSSCSRLV